MNQLADSPSTFREGALFEPPVIARAALSGQRQLQSRETLSNQWLYPWLGSYTMFPPETKPGASTGCYVFAGREFIGPRSPVLAPALGGF